MLTMDNTPQTIEVTITLEDLEVIQHARKFLEDFMLRYTSGPLFTITWPTYVEFRTLCNRLSARFDALPDYPTSTP